MLASEYENKQVDPLEAPEGYIAISKSQIPARTGARADENICHFCDWRRQCADPDVAITSSKQRCMSYPLHVVATGEEIQRNDGCSVIFITKPDA